MDLGDTGSPNFMKYDQKGNEINYIHNSTES